MLSTWDFLAELHRRGAWRISRVSFRKNRSTVWSITQGGRALNVHAAFRTATPEVLGAFATIARAGGVRSAAGRQAAALIGSWPALESAIRAAREAYGPGPVTRCCATPAQRRYLDAVYDYLNVTRFGGSLPGDVPVRLSRRMKSVLGHMAPAQTADDERRIREIALNVDLMLAGNAFARIDTLLHEMAHAADFLESGCLGHGPSWRAWAQRVGCEPTRQHDRPIKRRARRGGSVTRVPPLPPAITMWREGSR